MEIAYCFSGLETLITTAVLVSVQDEVFVVSLTETMVIFVEGE